MLRTRPRCRYLLALLPLLVVCPSASTAELTPDRIAAMPVAERTAWQTYYDKSVQLAQADQAALMAEVKAHGLTTPLKAPDGGDFKLSAKPNDPWFGSEEALKLAQIILSYQAPNGGWSKHLGFTKGPRQPGMQWTSQSEPGRSPHYLSTLDNRSTTEEIICLAEVWKATQRPECAEGVIRGINYLLTAQYPNGGWPQVFPLEGDYHDDITLNDDAMTHVLELFHDISQQEQAYPYLAAETRLQVKKSLARGIRCVLAMQVRHQGQPAGWCAQHDPLTLQPTAARKMEPITLSGVESARMLKFLMTVSEPSPELVAAIEGGLDWLESVKLTNIRKLNVNGKTSYVTDASSTEVYWARFYDQHTLKPVFPGRDGVLYDSFEALARNNALGYDYYSTIPASIVGTSQKKWRKMLTEAKDK